MVHLLTFIILFCSLSVQRWSGIFFRETGVIAGSTNFSSNKRSLRYQSSKTSRLMELKHESITLSSLVILSRRASTQPNLLNLNLFFPRRWRRPRSRLSPFSLPPRPGFRAEKRSAQASEHPLSQAQGGLFCVLTTVCLFVTERVPTKTE